MPRSHPAQRYLVLGLATSLLVHVGVGVVAGVTPAGSHRPDHAAQGVEMALLFPDPDEVPLGLEESDAQTEAWVGFQQATDHQAVQSEVEQSALTPTPAGGQPTPSSLAATPSPEQDSPAESTAEPAHEPASESASGHAPETTDAPAQAAEPNHPPDVTEFPALEPSEQPPADAPSIQTPPTDAPEPLLESAQAPLLLIPTPIPAPDPFLEMLQEAPPEHSVDPAILLAAPPPPPPAEPSSEPSPVATPIQSAPAEPESQPEPPPPPTPEAAPPSPASEPTPPGEAGLLPGEKSPSESSAAALDAPIDARPGRVLAARGLQITTVRPVFSTSVVALARPRSPTLVIEFGYDGRVRRARYLDGKSTGEPEVDRPLLDAVYRWTAAGDPLKRLSEDPQDTVSITMRIILR